MFSRKEMQRGYRRSHVIRWFLTGFASIVLLAGVFASGYQIGKGNWDFGIGRSAIPANQTLPDELDYSSVNEVYQALKRRFDGQLNVDDLLTGLKRGLVNAAGDPYTVYLDADEAEEFNEQLNGSFSGIGAELGKKDGQIVIIAPIKGFPAEKAGLKAGDMIIAIDDQDATGLSVEEAVQRIRGEKGTEVKLTIIRNSQEQLDIKIIRDIITIPSVEYEVKENNIGYIYISRFAEDTLGLVNEAIDNFKSQNVKGVVLDLRNNPGGYLKTAVDIADIWLEPGRTVLQEKRDGKVSQTYISESNGSLVGMPTIVLINEGSASASEIVAGALKDNNAAQIVGMKSYGKGSVQEVTTFKGGDLLKVTIARWYTPGGKNIDEEGVEPDVQIDISEQDIKASNDSQLNKAIELLKKLMLL
jgi:carboxyl-terminal processing protease